MCELNPVIVGNSGHHKVLLLTQFYYCPDNLARLLSALFALRVSRSLALTAAFLLVRCFSAVTFVALLRFVVFPSSGKELKS